MVFNPGFDAPFPRPPSMEQDPEVIALARKIYTAWMEDERFTRHQLAYFWAEVAARAALMAR
jgi:hypothetical protein